mmetsp:Transcript_148/g.373  ORF Transcript_148/g.373 Transcript_148/m.373 type:complete len:95 (+) Transcript_148:1506-1790(+)
MMVVIVVDIMMRLVHFQLLNLVKSWFFMTKLLFVFHNCFFFFIYFSLFWSSMFLFKNTVLTSLLEAREELTLDNNSISPWIQFSSTKKNARSTL